MILSAVAILIVLAIAYIWASRGFFSALIHLVCVIISGAIAFAAWEPVTYAIMNADSSRSAWLIDLAWGLGLGVPFAVCLAVLRLGIDALLPKNTDLDGVSNLVGGGVCGLISGVITAGIFVLSLSSMRFESSLMGYEPFGYDNNGSVVRTGGLLLPVDRLTARLYSSLSNSTFSVDDSMSKWRPKLADEGALLRMNNDDGKARHTMKPGSFEVFGRYTVEAASGLLNDSFGPKKYSFTNIEKELVSDGASRLDGFVVKFTAAANEKSGRILVGNSQVRLVFESNGSTDAVQAVNVISEADAPTRMLGRWMFDSQKVFISTVQGRNEVPMAFEFMVPKDSKPLALYIKGMRFRVDDDANFKPFATYHSTLERDAAIRSGQITPTGKVVPINPATAVQVLAKSLTGQADAPIQIRDGIPGNHVLQRDDLQGLEADESGKKILSGETKFDKNRLQGRNADPALQVRAFSVPDDQFMVQVIVDSRNTGWGFVSNAAANIDLSAAPVLVGKSGARYPAYGYVYETGNEVWFSYTPQSVVSSVSSLPTISKSTPNNKLTLLYRVGRGVSIQYFAVGETALAEFVPGYDIKR